MVGRGGRAGYETTEKHQNKSLRCRRNHLQHHPVNRSLIAGDPDLFLTRYYRLPPSFPLASPSAIGGGGTNRRLGLGAGDQDNRTAPLINPCRIKVLRQQRDRELRRELPSIVKISTKTGATMRPATSGHRHRHLPIARKALFLGYENSSGNTGLKKYTRKIASGWRAPQGGT